MTVQQQVVRPQLSEEEKKKKVKELQVIPALFISSAMRHEISSTKANYGPLCQRSRSRRVCVFVHLAYPLQEKLAKISKEKEEQVCDRPE